jgi:predicted RNA binding protein YcfA (HicA-like mRNA interferase family)
VGEKWPSMRGRQLEAILVRECGEPVRRSGSHRTFERPDGLGTFTFSYHDSREVPGSQVRRILVADVGLSVERARKVAR